MLNAKEKTHHLTLNKIFKTQLKSSINTEKLKIINSKNDKFRNLSTVKSCEILLAAHLTLHISEEESYCVLPLSVNASSILLFETVFSNKLKDDKVSGRDSQGNK